MKALYTGMLRRVIQWAGDITKKDVFTIIEKMVEINDLKHADGKKYSGEEKAAEAVKFVGSEFVPSSKKWIINLLVQGIFAYARYKGKL